VKYPLEYDRMEYAASDGKARSAPHPIVAYIHGRDFHSSTFRLSLSRLCHKNTLSI